MAIFQRLLNVFRPVRLDRELNDELEFHREMRLRRLRERGLGEAEAEAEVNKRMGNVSVAKEEMRDARVVQWLASSLQDLRHGLVLLRRDSGISALIILVLALGIGGNAAIFSLLKAAFLDPLPYRDSTRLVTIIVRRDLVASPERNPTVPEYIDIRNRAHMLDDSACVDFRDFQLTGTDEPARVFAARVTASFFPLLGISPSMGRTFFAEESLPGRNQVVLVSDAFWRGKMAADTGAVGKTLRLNGDPFLVVGVLPPEFSFDYPSLGVPEPPETYVPYLMDADATERPTPQPPAGADGIAHPYSTRPRRTFNPGLVRVLARLREGSRLAQAASELQSIANSLVHEYPDLYHMPHGEIPTMAFVPRPLREAIVGSQRALLGLLLGGVGVLLLIACANTAQLLLARGLRRGREVAVRAALGASRLRLIRQFLLEGLVLAVCGGAAGLLFSGTVARILVGLFPERNPIIESAHTDPRLMGFTLGLSLLSALIFAIVPAIKGSMWSPGSVITARLAIGQGNRWRHGMMAVEAALSVFLLCGAGLVGQNLWKLVSTPPGFDPNHVLAMQLRLSPEREQAARPIPSVAYQEYLEKVQAIRGVESAAIVQGPPLRPAVGGYHEIIGQANGPDAYRRQIAWSHLISPDYFRTLRIPLLAGRTFNNDDGVGRPQVVIVNREFVRRFGIEVDPIGRKIDPGEPWTIVGVVGDVRMNGLDTAPFPEVYAPLMQVFNPNVYVLVRSTLPPGELVTRVKTAIRSSFADQAVFKVETMEQVLSSSQAEPRFYAFVIGAFALLALAMAASGMYSVISCLVSQRTGEIAIRIALGASRGAIVNTILGTTSVWVSVGLAGGLGLALAANRMLRGLTNSATQTSPFMYGAALVFFLVVTLLAAYLPARRASRLDPAMALRCE
jgi:predicted permease